MFAKKSQMFLKVCQFSSNFGHTGWPTTTVKCNDEKCKTKEMQNERNRE